MPVGGFHIYVYCHKSYLHDTESKIIFPCVSATINYIKNVWNIIIDLNEMCVLCHNLLYNELFLRKSVRLDFSFM
jgi:hypothetical protein